MTEGGIFESPLHVFKPPECVTVRSHHNAQLLWKTVIHGQVGRTVVRTLLACLASELKGNLGLFLFSSEDSKLS